MSLHLNCTRDQFTRYQCTTGRCRNTREVPSLQNAYEKTMITLLLVNDEPLIRQGLRMWLEGTADITVIGEASNGDEAIALAPVLHPDVVLMDISLLITDGIRATAALCASVPHSTVVLLSLYDDAMMRARAHAAGAVTLVGKHEGVKALLAAIRKAGGQTDA